MRVSPSSSTGSLPDFNISRVPPTPEEEDDLELEMKRADELAAMLAPETTTYGNHIELMDEDSQDEEDSEDPMQFPPPPPEHQMEVDVSESALLTSLVLDAYFTAGGACNEDPHCSQMSVYDDISIVYVQKPKGERKEEFHQKCVLECMLGTGKFSDVYKARLNDSPDPVAVKILKWNHYCIEKTFWREVEGLTATLENPATLDIIGFRGPPHYWIITPLMKGGTLHDLVEQRKLSPKEIIDISLQIVQIMDSLHQQRIMHRDLTPENLLVKERDGLEICLGDFGLSEFVPPNQGSIQGKYLSPNGHPRYRAPEVAKGGYSFAAEVYNFGSCLYEMLARQRPLHDISDAQVGAMIQRGLIPLLPRHEDETEQEAGLVELVSKCWEYKPTLRPSWADISTRLRQLSQLK